MVDPKSQETVDPKTTITKYKWGAHSVKHITHANGTPRNDYLG